MTLDIDILALRAPPVVVKTTSSTATDQHRDVTMLLRCCIATLLLLVGGCAAQCLNDTYDDCLQPWCEVYSDEDGQRYITRLTLIDVVELTFENLSASRITSCTVKADGTVVSRANVTFIEPVRLRLRDHHEQGVLFWVTKSPFVEDFWLHRPDWPGVTHLSVHMYNMSVNQTYVSNLDDNTLEELELTGNSWTNTSGLSLRLRNLKKLSLSDNQIEFLHEGMLDECRNLEVLDLSRNKIEHVNYVFSHLIPLKATLKELNLAKNIITKFYANLWDSSWHLKKVNASYNQIWAGTRNPTLLNCEIDLSFNNLTTYYGGQYPIKVDQVILAGQNISTLSEVGAILSNIDNELFEYQLRYVEVSYDNFISGFAHYLLQSECTVDRKYIYCKVIGSNVFPRRESIFLNFTGNAIKFSTRSVLTIWPQNLLDLSENQLKVIKDIPAQIAGTRQLNLSRNSIGYISGQLFQNMTQLTVLDLSHNLLKHVQLILYSPLHMLDISNNYLNRMNISHSSSQYTTEYLNLSHNSFTNIRDEEWLQFDEFSKVDLGENNLKCCGPEWQYSRTMFRHYRKKILNINSSKAFTCVMGPYKRAEMTSTWLREDHCQNNIHVWTAFGCLLLLFPLLINSLELLDYFLHQTERDLAERLTRLKEQGLEQDENCALECDYDAFVCHSHKDAGWVTHELVPNLENDRDGHRLCIHYRNFPLGSLIEENVEKAINKSRKVIVVVTRSFLDSYWCKMELTYAWLKMLRERRNFIIVIEVDRIPEDKRPPILAYLMHSRTYLEWPEAPSDDVKKNCWRRVRDALGKSLRDRHQESGTAVIQMDFEDDQNV